MRPNKASSGRLLACGNIGQATERSDGRMEATIRINPDELVRDPPILAMPHGGDIELEIINAAVNTHFAFLACKTAPSTGPVRSERRGAPSSRPALARHVRLTFDRTREQHVLLEPESVVVLNGTGGVILGLEAANEGTVPREDVLTPRPHRGR
jgi:hypothetical protein